MVETFIGFQDTWVMNPAGAGIGDPTLGEVCYSHPKATRSSVVGGRRTNNDKNSGYSRSSAARRMTLLTANG
jgi:hypothetical protein